MSRRGWSRPSGFKSYNKFFLLSVEGDKTEKQYFELFNRGSTVVHVECLKSGRKSAPEMVLKRMVKRLKEYGIKESDEAWLVVDKDQWTDQQISELYLWSEEAPNYALALSNPKFEYWLLLHFEDPKGIESSRDCSQRLARHIVKYDKKLDIRKFSKEMVEDAISRARKRDNPPCKRWPENVGTTVYRLVENILQV